MNYWLMKSEADCYSIDDLRKDKRTAWDGVRNYQARNFMRDDMSVGDLVLFYHSNANPSGVAGIAKVASKAHPDLSQFDTTDMHYDSKATKEKPLWFCVDVSFVKKFKEVLPLPRLRMDPKLKGLAILEPGSRLSVTPVSEKHFRHILSEAEAL